MSASRRDGGFVLLEVLVAVAVLAGGCAALVQAMVASLRAARLVQERAVAALAVEDAVWTMDRDGGAFDAAQAQAPEGFADAQWRTQTETAQLPGGGTLMRRGVELSWTSAAGRPESFELGGYYDPDGAAQD